MSACGSKLLKVTLTGFLVKRWQFSPAFLNFCMLIILCDEKTVVSLIVKCVWQDCVAVKFCLLASHAQKIYSGFKYTNRWVCSGLMITRSHLLLSWTTKNQTQQHGLVLDAEKPNIIRSDSKPELCFRERQEREPERSWRQHSHWHWESVENCCKSVGVEPSLWVKCKCWTLYLGKVWVLNPLFG